MVFNKIAVSVCFRGKSPINNFKPVIIPRSCDIKTIFELLVSFDQFDIGVGLLPLRRGIVL